jgi:hypothetical protein
MRMSRIRIWILHFWEFLPVEQAETSFPMSSNTVNEEGVTSIAVPLGRPIARSPDINLAWQVGKPAATAVVLTSSIHLARAPCSAQTRSEALPKMS